MVESRNLEYRKIVQNLLELQNYAVLEFGNKTANVNIKTAVYPVMDQKPQQIVETFHVDMQAM